MDTDAHHGDGTRQLVQDDPEVLHICFCGQNYHSQDGSKIDINVYRSYSHGDPNAQYLEQVRKNAALVTLFNPDLLVWYYGFDTHADDYGSLGLSEAAYFAICDLMIATAADAKVPLQVVLGAGRSPTWPPPPSLRSSAAWRKPEEDQSAA